MSRLSVLYIVVGLCVVFAPSTVAQSVRGRVSEQSADEPIASVAVHLLTLQRDVVAQARTAEDGSYELKAPAPGRYQVRFQTPGYRPLLSEPITLAEGESLELSPKLFPLPPMMLDTVVVHGDRVPRYLEDFYRRRRMGFGTFFTRSEIDRIWPHRVSDLTPRLSGFKCNYDDLGNCVISNARSWRGFCPPVVFVDGVRVGNTSQYDIDMVPPEWLAALETYRSPAVMPVEFNVTGSACGVIALWTVR